MSLVHSGSLSKTLDAVNERIFFDKPIGKAERVEAATWIAARQGLPRSYRGLYAPFDEEFANGMRLFTGEKITTGAGTSHCLSEEAMRVLNILDVQSPEVANARNRAEKNFQGILCIPERGRGTFCCAQCSVSFLRHLATSSFKTASDELKAGMAEVRRHRTENGRWHRYPFYQTLLMLDELPGEFTVDEIAHAARACERLLKRKGGDDTYDIRRRAIAERILARA